MREVFAPSDEPPPDPGRVFYTIRREDVGKSVLQTTVGPIRLDFMGGVRKFDIGKRIYRVPTSDPSYWIWQVESQNQFEERMKGK